MIIQGANRIVFGGRDLSDFGVYVNGSGTYNAPERDRKTVAIPGRDGDLTIDNGRYKNIKVKYNAFIIDDFERNIEALRNYLLSITNYVILEDTYHPDEYRLARYSGSFTAKPVDKLNAGEFTLTFDCKPQRYLRDGDKNAFSATVSADGYTKTIVNPTNQVAKPIFTVYTRGDNTIITVNGVAIKILKPGIPYATQKVIVDCEKQDAKLSNGRNGNRYLVLTDKAFPELKPGNNTIFMKNGTTGIGDYFSDITIQPRWWTV
jgi:predicted phage tail component-like protein